ncbi:MAG: efflux RND transporter periplasmic adaptor subunit [Pseudomonadota bacterium]
MTETSEDVASTLGLNRAQTRWGRWGTGMAAIVLAGVGAWYVLADHSTGDAITYNTEPLTRGNLTVTVTATGGVEPTNLFEISSELSGTVSRVLVDHNSVVREGQVLAELDDRKLQAMLDLKMASLHATQARMSRAAASLENAKVRLKAAVALDQRGITSEQSLLAQETEYQTALAEMQSAEADRDLAKADLELQKVELENSCICSPVDGVVLDRSVEPGQIVAASFSAPVLFTLAEDLTQMELRVDVDEADIGRIKVGQKAQFTVDAYDDMVFPAEILELWLAPETVDGVVTYKAILSIDNEEMLLRPGMTATADIIVNQVEDGLLVPNAALRYAPPVEEADGGDDRSGLLGMLLPTRPPVLDRTDLGRAIFVLDNGEVRRIEISRGDSDGSKTAVTGSGIEEGLQVITGRLDG